MRKEDNKILAVDLGGTRLRAAIVTASGKIIKEVNRNTNAVKGPQYILDNLFNALKDLLKICNLDPRNIKAISVAVAGAVDVNEGILTTSPNIPGLINIPLRKIILKEFGIKTFIENDVNAAAVGEFIYGKAKNVKNFVFLSIGTGIGGGIFINGKLYGGVDGTAGEIGHMVIKDKGPRCKCGNRGCLEALCSGSAIEREMIKKLRKHKITEWMKFDKKRFHLISAREIGEAAAKGDKLSLETINEASYYLGIGIGNIINIFNPQMIVLGGGVSGMGRLLIEPAEQYAMNIAFKLPAESVKIVQSALGNKAGILGASALSEYIY